MLADSAPILASLRDAARVCRHVQRDIDRLRSMTKDDRSPVTIADYASQAVVARAIIPSRAPLVAEESADFLAQPEHQPHLDAVVAALRDSAVWPEASASTVLDTLRRGAGEPLSADADEPWWTLDPIDGTKGFIRGQQYAIALACIRRGRVILGAMACPNLSLDREASVDEPDPRGTLYIASTGAGVTEWSLARPDGQRLPGRAAHASPVLAESVDSGHSDHSLSSQLMSKAVGEHRIIRLDSQAKYAVVARGQADVYLRLPTRKGYVERIWDHAAGSIIAQEAGCTVTDLRGRQLDFSRGRGLEANTGILVAPPALHARLIAAIAASAP